MLYLKPSGKPACFLQAAAIALTILLPCLTTLVLFGHAFPFYLKGPQFLLFYGLHILLGTALWYGYPALQRLLYKRQGNSLSLKRLLLVTGGLLAIARIGQGCYHHKPVLYLVLLTAGYLLFLWNARQSSGAVS